MERLNRRNIDKNFNKMALSIAIPIALQNLITSSVNMLDTLMVTTLGELELASVGLANQIFFIYAVIIFGIATGSSVFIAQYWGRRDSDNIKKVMGLGLSLTIVLGIIFTIAIYISPEFLMSLLTKDERVIQIGGIYLHSVAPSYIFSGIAMLFGIASRSIGQAKMPMFVSIVSLVTNAFFNYVLIFGKLGFPKLGLVGAAYGTVIARLAELTVTLYAVYKNRENPLAGKLNEFMAWDRKFINRYLKTSSPVIINELFWSIGTVLYSVAYARIGVIATAAVQILSTVQNIATVFTRGLANACTVIVGTEIGAGREEKAIEYAKRFLKLAAIIGLIIGLILFLSSEIVLKVFKDISPELYNTSNKLIRILGLFFVIRVLNGTLVVGILRGGGDTKFSAILEAGSVWILGVPLAFLGATVLKLPVHLVVTLVYTSEIVTAIIGAIRVKSDKWVKNIIEE